MNRMTTNFKWAKNLFKSKEITKHAVQHHMVNSLNLLQVVICRPGTTLQINLNKLQFGQLL